MTTCNGGGFCEYRFQEGSRIGCRYGKLCDYQLPYNSAHNENELKEEVCSEEEIHSDYKEHNKMTLPLLAEHLGVELWKAMEIARMISLRPQVKE